MKTLIISISLQLFNIIICYAQTNFIWPISQNTIDFQILFKPNDYISNEYNSSTLIISGQEDSYIVSPVKGKVINFSYSYYNNLKSMHTLQLPVLNYCNDLQKIKNLCSPNSYAYKNITASIRIQTNEGDVISLEGIKPIKQIKTGTILNQGDTIGKLGFFYYKIIEPSLCITIEKNNIIKDPMSPFGLKTTFIETKRVILPNKLCKQNALDDYSILIEALEEGYPGLFDYLTITDWDSFKTDSYSKLQDSIDYQNFKKLIIYTIHQLRDSHINIIQNPSKTIENKNTNSCYYFSSVYPGFLNDSLIIVRTLDFKSSFYKKKIKSINNLTPDQFKNEIEKYILGYDGYNQSLVNYQKLAHSWKIYEKYIYISENPIQYNIVLEDDSLEKFPIIEINQSNKNKTKIKFYPDWSRHFFQDNNFVLEKINKSLAYIKIPSFDIDETQMFLIKKFFCELSDSSVTAVLIDLRNNNGGDIRNLIEIFSFIALEPFKESVFTKVNDTSNYKFFENCSNYYIEEASLFPDYCSQKGEVGFYNFNYKLNFPDTLCNFKREVYILVNEQTFSAATIFAALVHKYKRGKIIGRETGSSYYQMNAIKFANLVLPNSQIEIRIPLVKTVFDTLTTHNIPWGRGVIPDFEIKLSLEEISWENEDVLFNSAIEIINKEIMNPNLINNYDKK